MYVVHIFNKSNHIKLAIQRYNSKTKPNLSCQQQQQQQYPSRIQNMSYDRGILRCNNKYAPTYIVIPAVTPSFLHHRHKANHHNLNVEHIKNDEA